MALTIQHLLFTKRRMGSSFPTTLAVTKGFEFSTL